MQGPPVQAVVRFNGGAQAAHHVVDRRRPPPHVRPVRLRHLTPGTRTFLSRYMLVDPLALVAEAEHLAQRGVADPLSPGRVDRGALLTTPYHRAANQAREQARGDGRHGSCGMGIGETARVRARPTRTTRRAPGTSSAPGTLVAQARPAPRPAGGGPGQEFAGTPGFPVILAPWSLPWPTPRPRLPRPTSRPSTGRRRPGDPCRRRLPGAAARAGPVVFEGAQGVLLDEWRGFHPYTTWSTTTFENAETLLRESGSDGDPGSASRAPTRPGTAPARSRPKTRRCDLAEPHNADGRWQGPFRAATWTRWPSATPPRSPGEWTRSRSPTSTPPAAHAGELRICRGYGLERPIASPR